MSEMPRDLARNTLAIMFIAGLLAGSFAIIQPFLAATVWATTLVIASWPVMLRVQSVLGGRRGPAVAVMTLVLVMIVLIPLWLAITTIVGQSDRIAALIDALPDFHLPALPDWVAGLPMVGPTIVERWTAMANLGVGEVAKQLTPYAGTVTQWFVGAVGGLGGLFVQLVLTIAISAVLYSSGEAAATICRRFGFKSPRAATIHLDPGRSGDPGRGPGCRDHGGGPVGGGRHRARGVGRATGADPDRRHDDALRRAAWTHPGAAARDDLAVQ